MLRGLHVVGVINFYSVILLFRYSVIPRFTVSQKNLSHKVLTRVLVCRVGDVMIASVVCHCLVAVNRTVSLSG